MGDGVGGSPFYEVISQKIFYFMNGFPYITFFSLTGLHTFCPKCSSKLYPLILHGPEKFSKLGNLFTQSNFQNQFTWRQITIFPANPSFASLTVKQVKLVGLNGVTLEWQFDLAGKKREKN